MITKTLTLVKNNRKELARFLKFCVVGVTGTAVDFGTLNLLIQLFGFSKILANTCSFSLALLNNFIWNRLWVYPETRGEPLLGQFAQFTVVNIAGWAINTSIFYGADRWVWGEAGLLAGPVSALALAIGIRHFDLAYNLAKALATGVVLFWNFFVNRVWTFRHVK